jgi:two-component system response regulator RegA
VIAVLIIDDQLVFAEQLGEDFRQKGAVVHLCDDLAQARADKVPFTPTLIVSELRVRGRSFLNNASTLIEDFPAASIAVVTAFPAVATASAAFRVGVKCYLSKPARAETILHLVQAPGDEARSEADEAVWPSLNRTIWEYVNQVYAISGSMSEAARRLRLDRRSLRRMLQRNPPGM